MVDFLKIDYWGIGLNALPEIVEDGDDDIKGSEMGIVPPKQNLKRVVSHATNAVREESLSSNILKSLTNKELAILPHRKKSNILNNSKSDKSYESFVKDSLYISKKNGVCVSMFNLNLTENLRGILNEKTFPSKIVPSDSNVLDGPGDELIISSRFKGSGLINLKNKRKTISPIKIDRSTKIIDFFKEIKLNKTNEDQKKYIFPFLNEKEQKRVFKTAKFLRAATVKSDFKHIFQKTDCSSIVREDAYRNNTFRNQHIPRRPKSEFHKSEKNILSIFNQSRDYKIHGDRKGLNKRNKKFLKLSFSDNVQTLNCSKIKKSKTFMIENYKHNTSSFHSFNMLHKTRHSHTIGTTTEP